MRFPDGSRCRRDAKGAGRRAGRLWPCSYPRLRASAWLIVYVVDTDELRQALARIGARGLVQPVLIASATLSLAAERWRTLLLGLGYAAILTLPRRGAGDLAHRRDHAIPGGGRSAGSG